MRVDDSVWRARLVRRFGPGVLGWCAALPVRVAALAAEWELEVGEPFPTGATSCVLAVTRADGTPAVLKLSPEPALIAEEGLALDAWDRVARTARPAPLTRHTSRETPFARHTPRVLARAPDALLLERVLPGERLKDRAGPPPPAAAVAGLVGALHVPPPSGVAPLADRLRFVYARADADAGLVARGLRAALALAADHAGPPVLLHGDLHAGNVLVGGDGLVAIDPRPCAGDPAFDLIDWVAHGDPHDTARDLGEATGGDPERLLRWLRAAAVLLG